MKTILTCLSVISAIALTSCSRQEESIVHEPVTGPQLKSFPRKNYTFENNVIFFWKEGAPDQVIDAALAKPEIIEAIEVEFKLRQTQFKQAEGLINQFKGSLSEEQLEAWQTVTDQFTAQLDQLGLSKTEHDEKALTLADFEKNIESMIQTLTKSVTAWQNKLSEVKSCTDAEEKVKLQAEADALFETQLSQRKEVNEASDARDLYKQEVELAAKKAAENQQSLLATQGQIASSFGPEITEAFVTSIKLLGGLQTLGEMWTSESKQMGQFVDDLVSSNRPSNPLFAKINLLGTPSIQIDGWLETEEPPKIEIQKYEELGGRLEFSVTPEVYSEEFCEDEAEQLCESMSEETFFQFKCARARYDNEPYGETFDCDIEKTIKTTETVINEDQQMVTTSSTELRKGRARFAEKKVIKL